MVVWSLKHAHVLDRLHVQVPTSIFMYGPLCCSKTMVATAITIESGLNFIAGSELFSKWVGESERAVHNLFRFTYFASLPIILFNEIHAIANSRFISSNS